MKDSIDNLVLCITPLIDFPGIPPRGDPPLKPMIPYRFTMTPKSITGPYSDNLGYKMPDYLREKYNCPYFVIELDNRWIVRPFIERMGV